MLEAGNVTALNVSAGANKTAGIPALLISQITTLTSILSHIVAETNDLGAEVGHPSRIGALMDLYSQVCTYSYTFFVCTVFLSFRDLPTGLGVPH